MDLSLNRRDKAISFLISHCFDSIDSVFPFSLILNSLNEIQSFKLNGIKNKIFNLLIKEKSKNQSFNYWSKNSTKYIEEPYPNDFDDTFCVWTALFNYKTYFLGQKEILDLANLLISNQRLSDGAYYTWVINHQKQNIWNDVDFVVNLNIARFLHSQNIVFNKLNNFIEGKIKSLDLNSIYYKGELPSLYFLSFFYNGQEKNKIKDKLIFYLSQKIEDSSILLLYISILRFGFLGLIKKKDLEKVFSLQRKDGSVAGFDFYFYKNKNTGEKFYKSDLVSTALFLEFLSLLDQNILKHKKKKENIELLRLFKKKLTILNDKKTEIDLLKRALPIVYSKDNDFSLFMLQRLIPSTKNEVYLSKNIILSLSLINLFAWIAYTIYDHINDSENYQKKLPLANIAMQFLMREFYFLPRNENYFSIISNLFLKMEINSLKENELLRLEKNFYIKISKIKQEDIYKLSLQKSIAQTFSLCFFLEYFSFKDRNKIVKVYENIILIKQINDDLKDCFVDLKNKQINFVNYFLLKELNSILGKELFSNSDKTFVRKVFVKKIVPLIFTKIFSLIDETKNLLGKQNLLKNDNFFMKILSNYEKMAMKDMRKNKFYIN